MQRTVALCALLAIVADGSTAAADPKSDERVRKWVEKLRDAKASQRLKAVQELGKLSVAATPALPALLSALSDPDAAVRREAQLVVTAFPLQALVEVARGHTDSSVRGKAVGLMGDQAALEALARTAPPDTAGLAFARLKDPHHLAALARSGPAEMRPTALGRIDDPALLVELARNGPEGVREAALARLKDAASLGALAVDGPPAIRRAAAERLLELAGGAPPDAGAALVARIQDRALLVELARTASPKAAQALVRGSNDVEVLAALVTREDPSVARMAVSRTTDPRTLDAATQHPDELVRLEAARRVEAQQKVAELARGDRSERVRLLAASRLTGTETLTRLARGDASPAVRRLATFLLRQPQRGKKPVVAVHLRGDRLVDLLRRRLPALLENRALVFECPVEECRSFSSLVAAEVSVTSSNQCFQKFYFSGPCSNPGKDVSVSLSFYRDAEKVGERSFAARTPSSVDYKVTTYGGVTTFDPGPSAEDVWRSTEKAVRAEAAGWSLTQTHLDRLLAW